MKPLVFTGEQRKIDRRRSGFGCNGLERDPGAVDRIGFLTRINDSFSRSSIVVWYALAPPWTEFRSNALSHLDRTVSSSWYRHASLRHRGAQPSRLEVAKNAIDHPECGLKVLGFYDDRGDKRQSMLSEDTPPFLGGLDQMIQAAKKGEIDTVLVTLPMRAEQRIRDVLAKLGDTTAAVYIVPDFFVFELLHSRWSEVGGLPVSACSSRRSMVLTVGSSDVAISCWLDRIDTPLPAFLGRRHLDQGNIRWPHFLSPKALWFGRKRNPRMEVPFDADLRQWAGRQTSNQKRPACHTVGAILRRTSIDELPQLINVLEGSMSLVGPRPHASAHNEHFRRLITGYMLRHKVKPGITGLAQVEGSRGETDTIEKMEARIALDHRYIRDWSLWLDLKILFRTVWVVLRATRRIDPPCNV